jgi:alkylated DNA nucleotide flippase Atl1
VLIDKVTGKRRETTSEECISVIEKNAEGKSYREIAELTGISRSQTAEIVKGWKTQTDLNDLPSVRVVLSAILKCFLTKVHPHL